MKMPLDDAAFVKDDKEYLLDKGSGGKSNRRGYQYEMRFGAWELIKLALRVRNDKLDPHQVTVTSQMPCYIDDLVIEEVDTVRHFEMKSGDSITWGDPATRKTLSWNFKRQREFDERHTQRATYTLALAETERHRVLGGKAPQLVTVIHFPLTYTVTEIDAVEKDFISTLSHLLSAEVKNRMLALLAGPDRLHYKFNRNDVYLAFLNFNAAYDSLEAAVPRLLHDILENLDLISRGSLSYHPRNISEKLRTKLREISGIVDVETCEGTLFLKSVYGVLMKFPAGLGSEAFRDFAAAVLAGKVLNVNDLHEWF